MNKFKTNIKCSGCIQKVKPILDEIAGIGKWDVDLNSQDRILTVEGDITGEKIIDAITAAGYRAEKIG